MTFLPVFITGTFVFSQPLSSYQAKVKIIFNGTAASTQIEKSPLKYNKDFAYSFTFDDGKEDAYTNVYPLFSGGVIQEKNMQLPGLFFSDGCGNKIPFKGGLAINSVNSVNFDPHEGTPESITWDQVRELYSKGWNVFNHSFNHSHGPGTNYAYQVTENTNYLKSKTGITTSHFVVPSGDTNYVPAAFANGMKAVYNQQSNFPGADGIKVDGAIDLTNFKLYRRFISDENYNSTNIREKIDLIASQSSATNHLWFTDFTHNVSFESKGGSVVFSTFQNYMNYIESTYGVKGADNIWMAPLQEVYEYLLVREGINYSTEISQDTLIVYLDFSSISEDLNNYSLSFNINSPQDITNIVAENLEDFSFKGQGSDKILNITWKKSSGITPVLSPAYVNPCYKENHSIVSNNGNKEIKINMGGTPGETIDILIYNNLGNLLHWAKHVSNGQQQDILIDAPHKFTSPGIYIVKILREKMNCEYIKKIVIY